MNRVTVRVDGAQKLAASMGRVSADARAKVKRTVMRLGIMLQSHIQHTKLRGQRLNQRSGRLISSIHPEFEETSNELTSTVGTNVEYARVHEYGMSGSVEVKAHMREIKQAFGRPIEPRSVMVRAHPMKVNVSEKRFMRDSLIEFKPTATQELQKVAEAIANEVKQ